MAQMSSSWLVVTVAADCSVDASYRRAESVAGDGAAGHSDGTADTAETAVSSSSSVPSPSPSPPSASSASGERSSSHAGPTAPGTGGQQSSGRSTVEGGDGAEVAAVRGMYMHGHVVFARGPLPRGQRQQLEGVPWRIMGVL